MTATVRHGPRPLLAGAEPFQYPGNSDLGVLLVHGFTGSPGELRPVGEALATADIGSASVLLRGHGTHPNDMVGQTYAEWIEDVELELERLLERHRRAVVVGLSMGGTLALNVAARHVDDPRLAGLVTISAPLFLSDWRLGLVGVISRVVKWQAWGRPDIKDQRVWDTHGAYRRIRTAAIPELLGLMRETNRMLARVEQPILIVHAREDHIVPPGNLDRIRDGVASRVKRSLLLDNCYHVSTVDFEAERLSAEIVRFIRDL